MTTTNRQTAAEHPVTNPATGECGNPDCACHDLARSDASQPFTAAEQDALLDLVISRAREDLNDGKPLTEMRADPPFNPRDHGFPLGVMCGMCRAEDEAFIASSISMDVTRAAIADVLDAGWCETTSLKYHWHFDPNDESEGETEARGRFIDMVVNRIVQLQRPPHGMDARDLWHDGYREGLAEGLRQANADLRQLAEKERR